MIRDIEADRQRNGFVQYWLMKTDPETYRFETLLREKSTVWDGVHNNQALIYLRQMNKGDEVLIYHTGDEKQIVGLAEVTRGPYPDPNADDEKTVVVEIRAKRKLKQPVSLARIKSDVIFADFQLVRLPRLSVMPVPPPLWKRMLEMAES